MLIKLGVDISRLERPIRRTLKSVSVVFGRQLNLEPVITSTYEGNHSPSSLHYANLAVDFRRPKVLEHKIKDLIADLKKTLGNDYDVVLEARHIHIEYDPD